MNSNKQAILLSDFSYSNDTVHIDLKKGDTLILLNKVDDKWWRVINLKKKKNCHNHLDDLVGNYTDGEFDSDHVDYHLLVPSSHIQITHDNNATITNDDDDDHDTDDTTDEFDEDRFNSQQIDDLGEESLIKSIIKNSSPQLRQHLISTVNRTNSTKETTPTNRTNQQQKIMAADLEKESDEAFGSSHESLDGIIECDNNNIHYNHHHHHHNYQLVSMARCDNHPRPNGDIEHHQKPIVKPRKCRKAPLYENIIPLNEKDMNNVDKHRKASPPSVQDPNVKMKRELFKHWYEYHDENGRLFYYNSMDNIASWKPPRRTTRIDSNDVAIAQRQFIHHNNHNNQTNSEEHYGSDSEIVLNKRVKEIVQNFNDDIQLSANLKRNLSFSKNHIKQQIQASKKHSMDSMNQNPLLFISNLLRMFPPEHWHKLTDDVYCTNTELTDQHQQSTVWFCDKDEKGRIYFYENQCCSQSAPMSTSTMVTKISKKIQEPTTSSSIAIDNEMNFHDENDQKYSDHHHHQQQQQQTPMNRLFNHERNLKAHSVAIISHPSKSTTLKDIKLQGRFTHSRPFQDYKEFLPPPPNKLDNSEIILHDPLLHTRTKVSGKTKRKHWTTSYVVLTKHYLFFFKDKKNMFTPQKADFTIALLNAQVEWCVNESSRKNCFKVITFQNQTLLQDDNKNKAKKWFENIKNCIAKLTPIENIPNAEPSLNDNFILTRSSSTKDKSIVKESIVKQGSNTIGGYTQFAQTSFVNIDKKKKIHERLLDFLKKRPTVESLREKGIFKDENVFGCNLALICLREGSNIPRFVHECVQAIEKNDITADGLYRACGNLSTVQKLRFEINQENYSGLWKETDVHVLTGLLKMFFRDMKEPLFPYDQFESLIKLTAIENKDAKLESFKSLIQKLPESNFHTLKFLLQHLLRVTHFSKQNRMHIQNLSIVFGPTLIRKMNDLNNLIFDMMLQVQQSQVVEFLLQEFETIFE